MVKQSPIFHRQSQHQVLLSTVSVHAVSLIVELHSCPVHRTQRLQQYRATNRGIAQQLCQKVLRAFSRSIFLSRAQQDLPRQTSHCSQWQYPQQVAQPMNPSPPRQCLQQRAHLACEVRLPTATWGPTVVCVAPCLFNNDARVTGFYIASTPPTKIEQLLLPLLWYDSQQAA